MIDYIVQSRLCGRALLDAAIPILEQQRAEARANLYDPTPDEVIGGLFARTFRFLQTFVLDYHLWAEDLGQVILRMMLESLLYLRFLDNQNQVELYGEFQKYGIGQEKLDKMQLRKLLEEGTIEDSPELRSFIASESDEELTDELVNVRLKNFEEMRKVATDAGMKQDYALHYQPYSVVIHGHWPALRRYHLMPCVEPLHRSHLQPSFELPVLEPELLNEAFRIFMDAYSVWRKRYGLEDRLQALVSQYFDCHHKAASSAPGPDREDSTAPHE